MKGFLCSVKGNEYEHLIYNVVKHTYINGKQFNIQKETDLAGCSSKNDICCIYKDKEIGIEAKKYRTPDWMQCSIKYDKLNLKWYTGVTHKIPKRCVDIFNSLINKLNIFNGKVPPFIEHNLTHSDWMKIKKSTTTWNDTYIDIPDMTISNLYKLKGCYYIQISQYGLYHTGIDICGFGVPKFELKQRLRIRTKIHTRKAKDGFCKLSVTVSCQPNKISNLDKSPYSLDDKTKLPPTLIYKESS